MKVMNQRWEEQKGLRMGEESHGKIYLTSATLFLVQALTPQLGAVGR